MSLANGPSDPSVTVQIKSKFEMEFRRISAPRSEVERLSLESFYRLVTDAHCLPRSAPVLICYQNPRDMRQTPLQSVEELKAALASSAPLLRLFVSRIRGLIVEVSGSEEEAEGDEEGGGGGEDKRNDDIGVGGRNKQNPQKQTKGNNRERRKGGGREKQNHSMSKLFQKAVSGIRQSPSTSSQPLTTSSHGMEDSYSKEEEEDMIHCSHPRLVEEEEDRCARREEERACQMSCVVGGATRESKTAHPDEDDVAVINNRLDQLSLSSSSRDPAEFQFVIEVYRIPSHFNTHDLWREFDDYSRSELCLKWVNDTHALGIFACERQAWLSAGATYRTVKTRTLRDGTEESITLAKKCANGLRPPQVIGEGRPKTTAMVARRLVSNALGIRVPLSLAQREKEKKELDQARENKRWTRQSVG